MHVLGFVIQDPNSDRQKVYSAFALSTGRYVASWGPANTKGQVEVRDLPIAEAVETARSKYRDKVDRGYTTTLIQWCVAEVPDATRDRDLRDTLSTAYRQGNGTTYMTERSAINQFMAVVGSDAQSVGASPSGPIAPAARSADKPALRLNSGESLVRPNGQVYRPRDLGGHTDVAALRAMRDIQSFVLLSGMPGTGKTALAEVAMPDLITVQCHGDMTVADLVGKHLPTPDGGFAFHYGPLGRAAKEGRALLLDEINMLPDETYAALHSALDGRNTVPLDDRPDLEPIKCADGFYVLGAYNPDTVGGSGLPEAILSRFPVQIEVTTDYDAARAMGVPPRFVRAAQNLAEREDVWAPQMRELLAAKTLIDAGLGEAFAAATMLGQCPQEADLAEVTEVLNNTLGIGPVQPLRLGAQV